MKPAKDEYRACGKEVLLNGSHYADGKDELAAQTIAYALNSVYLAQVGEPCRTCKGIGEHAPNCVDRRGGNHVLSNGEEAVR